ncbi:hypothetical protein VOI54_15020 [Tamlana sp. 2201CG12-4]|uniref:hypothetical protein n=1 Tax=Tamlana sp. 2201CG12-4 TaxID=3112582 RepID=UPI002DB7497A|nr:hypothetical protein [Tamlana sp. 2201CG12-4]MEC3908340.1 hypothetical protein [Tamlana sp. 2201CG12-4]
MESNSNVYDRIDDTFKALERIEQVNVSPFFKDKTMQRLFSEREEQQTAWSWFTPKLQLATLVCVVILNIIAFTRLQNSTYDDNVSEFAQSYGLSGSETSLLK